MLVFLNFLIILWLTFALLYSITQIIKGNTESINIVFIVFYIFFVIPIILDMVIGQPEYGDKPGFYLSSRDVSTSVIYTIYIGFIPIIWRIFKVKKRNNHFRFYSSELKLSVYIKILLYFLVISPFIGWLFSPEPLNYLKYAASPRGLLSIEGNEYHNILSKLCLISIIAVFLLLLSKKKITFIDFLLYVPWLIISIWLHGKRSIIMETIFLLIFTLWYKKILKGFKLICFVVIMGIIFLLYSNLYQTNYRYSTNVDNNYIYESIRIDFGRDDVTKLAIYAELNPDKIKILEYRFQSFWFNLVFFIPRDWWLEKPYPYDYYLTSAVELVKPQELHYKMTSSIFDESIANLGWFGLILGPIIILLICKVGDFSNNNAIRLLTILVASLLMAVQFVTISIIVIVWLVMVIFLRIKRKFRFT